MLGINGKQWNDIQWTDVEEFLNEIEESFFFEFKKDEVSGAKLIKEIAALANTYGGYVFLGVSDDKKIEGCQKWDEQRIHATIHDSLSPIPSFDVKKFETNDNKKIYIIKVDEGPEPPYITNKGEIYERISSGSFVIKESLRLSQMYTKKEDSWKKLEKKITIDSVQEKVENVLGYIDVGFEPTFTNLEDVKNCFFEISDNDLKQIFTDEIQDGNIMKFGDSLLFSYGNISGNKTLTPAHLNNFMEIMHDGSGINSLKMEKKLIWPMFQRAFQNFKIFTQKYMKKYCEMNLFLQKSMKNSQRLSNFALHITWEMLKEI